MDNCPVYVNSEIWYGLPVHEDRAQKITAIIAAMLARERQRQGLSKNRLASLSGLDPRAIALIENGERQPGIHTVLRITGALDIDLWRLLKEAESTKN